MDFLKSAVASAIAKGSSFPYTIGDRLENGESVFSLHKGTKREDGSECCIFMFETASNKARLPLARNAARKLRTLRHPGILKVQDLIETESHIYIITEKVTPLVWHVRRKSLSEETIKWGLYILASTLKFINGDAYSVHGNVRVSSIYTSESGEWKLGGCEVLSSMNEDDAIIYNYGTLVPESNRYAPPEVASNGWTTIKRHPLAAADAFGLGTVIFESFNGTFMGVDQLAQPRNIPTNLIQSYKRLINNNPKVRLTAAHFLDQGRKSGGFFQTPLIHITEGIDNLGLKNETEREELLSELDSVRDDFPEDFFKVKVLPELLKSVEFGGGGPKVFAAILKIVAKLSDDEFESSFVPVVNRLFSNPDRAMRVCLLDSLPAMAERIPQKDVNGKIFPAMVTGFTDTAPVVREQTVKAVLAVISKLSDRTINGELLRYLAKTANDEQPGIRTNTTICLGKIARNLGSTSRSKVLIAAFTRSLRDPFVHARNAALMALNATIDVFNDEDCASKILPALCMPLIDKEKIVREQANKTMDSYLQRVRKYASTMPDSALPTEISSGPNPSTTARMGNQADTSWSGWAISSFTNKMSAARGQMEPSAINGTSVHHPASQPSSRPASGRATPVIQVVSETSGTRSQNAPQNASGTVQNDEASEQEDLLDNWATMDDDGDSFFDASAEKQIAASSEQKALFDDGGEPDFAGWLTAQAKAKSKPPLPKGISRASGNAMRGTTRSNVAGRSVSGNLPTSAVSSKRPQDTASGAKVSAPRKPIGTVPKEPDPADDDWGAAWD